MTSNLQSIISITNQTFLLNSCIGIEHKLILSENFEKCFFMVLCMTLFCRLKIPVLSVLFTWQTLLTEFQYIFSNEFIQTGIFFNYPIPKEF